MNTPYDRVYARPGGAPIYESHHLKANGPAGPRGRSGPAFWIKTNLLVPRDRDLTPLVESWFALWRRRGEAPLVVKDTRPMSSVHLTENGLRIQGQDLLYCDREARGRIDDAGHKVSWRLQWESQEEALIHYPSSLFYLLGFPKKKILTPSPLAAFRGELRVDDELVPVSGWTGLRGHNWGGAHAQQYVYGNAVALPVAIRKDRAKGSELPALCLDGFSARIQVAGRQSPMLSLAVGRLRGQGDDLAFNAPRRWWNRSARVVFPEWSVTYEGPAGRLRTEWSLDPAEVAGLRYLHPDGKVSYCYNTKYARLRAELEPAPGGTGGGWKTDEAELEFVQEQPIPGLPLVGDACIPVLAAS